MTPDHPLINVLRGVLYDLKIEGLIDDVLTIQITTTSDPSTRIHLRAHAWAAWYREFHEDVTRRQISVDRNIAHLTAHLTDAEDNRVEVAAIFDGGLRGSTWTPTDPDLAMVFDDFAHDAGSE